MSYFFSALTWAAMALMRPQTALVAVVLLGALMVSLHRPLPHDLTERSKMTVVETALRLIYFYPVDYFL